MPAGLSADNGTQEVSMATQTDDQKAKAAAEVKALDARKAQEAKDAAEAQAKAEAEADAARPLDETVPGGRYVVNGMTVDANGEPVKG